MISIDWAPYEKIFSNTLEPLVCLGFLFQGARSRCNFFRPNSSLAFREIVPARNVLLVAIQLLAVRRKLKQQKSVLPSESLGIAGVSRGARESFRTISDAFRDDQRLQRCHFTHRPTIMRVTLITCLLLFLLSHNNNNIRS